MEQTAQFCDGERVDSSTGTAERLDAVKRDRSRCRRAETTAARRAATAAARPMGAFSTGLPVDWGLSQRPARVDCRLSYTLQVKPQSREARLWLVVFRFPCANALVSSANSLILTLWQTFWIS